MLLYKIILREGIEMTEKLLPPPLKAESKELTFTCDDDLSKKKKKLSNL